MMATELSPVSEEVATPSFKLVFVAVLILTILFSFMPLVLILMGKEGTNADRFSSFCYDLAKMGFAALVGLFGGKTLR